MRKRAVAASVLASMGILTIGWQVGAAAAHTGAPTGSAAGATAPTTAPAPSAAASTAPVAAAPAASGAYKDGTYSGAVAQTPFGNVQIKVTISGGKITGLTPLQLTDAGGRSVQISNYAAPILRQEVLAAQSTQVDNVSGATYTTDGYLQSVQSVLDQAKA
ncbi:FMN-binding protein [Lysinimonas soli]|uniref:FMN-binding protein n=1 Tax=Lysinimonas soli TaxID=1074233 RepID=A0ABW0NQB7_9MICO